MPFSRDILKATPSPPAASLEAPTDSTPGAPLLNGVLRGAQTHADAKVALVEGPHWSADFPVELQDPATAALESTVTADSSEEPVDIDAMQSTWAEEAEALRREAVAEARKQGYDEGYAAARQELAESMERDRQVERDAFAEDVARLDTVWRDHLARSEPVLVQLALEVAERLLEGTLPDDLGEAATGALTSAIERLATRAPLSVDTAPRRPPPPARERYDRHLVSLAPRHPLGPRP